MPCKPQWYNLEHYPKTNAPVSKWISSGQQAQEHARILGMSDHPKREKEQILRSSSDGTQGCCLGSYLSTPIGCLSGLHVLWRKGRILSVPPSSVSFLPFSFLPPFISGEVTGQKIVVSVLCLQKLFILHWRHESHQAVSKHLNSGWAFPPWTVFLYLFPLDQNKTKKKKKHTRYQIKFPQGGESLQEKIVECWANTEWAVLLSPTDVSLLSSISCLWYFRFSVLFGSKQTLIHQNFIKAEIHILGLR